MQETYTQENSSPLNISLRLHTDNHGARIMYIPQTFITLSVLSERGDLWFSWFYAKKEEINQCLSLVLESLFYGNKNGWWVFKPSDRLPLAY